MEKKKTVHPEIKGLLILSLSVLLLLSLASFVHEGPKENWLGIVGYGIGFALLYLFGLCSYLIVLYVGWIGWKLLINMSPNFFWIKSLYFGIGILSLAILLNVYAESGFLENPFIEAHIYAEIYRSDYPFPSRIVRFNLGGVPLYYLYCDLPTFNLQNLLSDLGVVITFSITGLVSLVLFTNIRVIPLARDLWRFFVVVKRFMHKVVKDLFPTKTGIRPILPETAHSSLQPPLDRVSVPVVRKNDSDFKISTHLEKRGQTRSFRLPMTRRSKHALKRFRLPPFSILTAAKQIDQPTLKKDLRRQADILEKTLLSFDVEAKVGQIHCGPTITSFEVHPPVGVKVQKIKVLADDIALNLQAPSIRIIAPIPGKAAVGVEVPSPHPQEVGFKEMLNEHYKSGKSLHIPILLGQTVTGNNVVCDLTKMPHCIIAGATGSGKSVCINSLVMSILMTASPDEIRLLLIDPKKVELSTYTNLPHMIAPVITEAHGAYAALSWLVNEMSERYEILKRLKLRNIHAFNRRKIDPEEEEELALGMQIPPKMPYFVVIIDEFADLMMASSSDLETPIARIVQMARAVGFHLVLATQRPSREVITGLIKANFPCRIAFKVASRVNSQIILDENGAENLLGNGDLLFLPPGSSQLIRAQGVFVRDEDINRAVAYIENQMGPQYLVKSFDHISTNGAYNATPEGRDDLYGQARSIVIQTGTASTTFLQRKLKIGYARAASLMDVLETQGVIGPQEGGRRRVLLKKEKQGQNK